LSSRPGFNAHPRRSIVCARTSAELTATYLDSSALVRIRQLRRAVLTVEHDARLSGGKARRRGGCCANVASGAICSRPVVPSAVCQNAFWLPSVFDR
jgi:hypothetical protein